MESQITKSDLRTHKLKLNFTYEIIQTPFTLEPILS
jgi:hypothetical protein